MAHVSVLTSEHGNVISHLPRDLNLFRISLQRTPHCSGLLVVDPIGQGKETMRFLSTIDRRENLVKVVIVVCQCWFVESPSERLITLTLIFLMYNTYKAVEGIEGSSDRASAS